MLRGATATAVFMIAALFGSTSTAGVYADDLSRCLVKSSTEGDKTALMQWMFSAFAANPAVKPMSSITPEQRDALDRKAAQLMQRLVLDDCRKETIEAWKYEGASTLETGFTALGEVAARGLMSDPAAAAGLQKLGDHLDQARWEALGKEVAGTAPVPAGTK
ncbi:MAG: hypothetical protein V4759_08290 [Pseudomonadota bacterium]